ncbi:MAG: ATP-dependent DNA helicase RecG, partial [Pelagibacteraceae bacterium]|nr:ATP-dependent DNA helicase RecG [Pelagibacteraceae bacterium]
VCPLVDDSDKLELQSVKNRLKDLSSYYSNKDVGMVHGKMNQEEKNDIMSKFKDGDIKILIATSVIEVGIDDPDATLMVIENAERFGLSQLHQLRGRVGRGKKQSSCILLFTSPLSDTAKKRLKIMKETNDGFKIAEEDLDIRGAGEILGARQSGLPEFKLSNLDVHKDLLKLARSEAVSIVENDPNLKTEKGKALRILLHLFKNEVAIDYLKSG